MSDLTLGQLITTPHPERDATHIAVAPVIAAEAMEPGQHIQLNHEGKACSGKEPIGIVDPLLRKDVMPGDKFWLWVYPKTVTNLRHDWSHPAFKEEKEEAGKKEAEAWLRTFAETWNMEFDEMVRGASTKDGGITASGLDIHSWSELDNNGAEFWRQLEIFTGKKFSKKHREGTYISCSC
jgi:hypothetical protein